MNEKEVEDLAVRIISDFVYELNVPSCECTEQSLYLLKELDKYGLKVVRK